jgi:hypothetical protein
MRRLLKPWILSPSCQHRNLLKDYELHLDSNSAPNIAPNRPPGDMGYDDLRGPEGIPDAETIIRDVRRMSDAERRKLLAALLGL